MTVKILERVLKFTKKFNHLQGQNTNDMVNMEWLYESTIKEYINMKKDFNNLPSLPISNGLSYVEYREHYLVHEKKKTKILILRLDNPISNESWQDPYYDNAYFYKCENTYGELKSEQSQLFLKNSNVTTLNKPLFMEITSSPEDVKKYFDFADKHSLFFKLYELFTSKSYSLLGEPSYFTVKFNGNLTRDKNMTITFTLGIDDGKDSFKVIRKTEVSEQVDGSFNVSSSFEYFDMEEKYNKAIQKEIGKYIFDNVFVSKASLRNLII